MKDVTLLGAALVVDALLGDPRWLPHPVIWIGRVIGALDQRGNKPGLSPGALRWRGILTVVIVVALTWSFSWLLVWGALQVAPVLGWLMSAVLLYFALAGRSLAQAAQWVAKPLLAGDLPLARQRIAMFVGRDTQQLDEAEIARATVETVAENFTDGYVAPLAYAVLGGAPLAMAYKAINTMDSMLGYKNERYLHFGWAAARLDDLANYLPARLAAVLLLVAGLLTGKNPWRAVGIWQRDARQHPSPNGGATEAVMAGLLGVQLGGLNYYGGIASPRGVLGDPGQPLTVALLRQSLGIYLVGCLLAAALACSLVYISGGWLVPLLGMG